MNRWLKEHKAQFKGKQGEFSKHVTNVSKVLAASKAPKADYVACAAKYGLSESIASRCTVTNLTTFIAASQFQAS